MKQGGKSSSSSSLSVEEEDEELPHQRFSDQIQTVEKQKKQTKQTVGNFTFPKFFPNPETEERVDGGKMRGLGESLKSQQETRGSKMIKNFF